MSSLFARSIISKACRLLPKPTQNFIVSNNLSNKAGIMTGLIKRSLPVSQIPEKVTFTIPCSGCCNYHTDADTSFSEYLVEEIKNVPKEKIPNIEGWKTETNNSSVTLSRTMNGEDIKVKMDINEGGAPDMMAPEMEEEFTELEELPPFVVEIKKPTGRTLRLNCEAFRADMEGEGDTNQPEESVADKIAINSVAIHYGEFKENCFELTRELMPEELYENLMDLLDGRGLDNEFVEQMLNFYVAYSNTKYGDFLEELSQFVEEK